MTTYSVPLVSAYKSIKVFGILFSFFDRDTNMASVTFEGRYQLISPYALLFCVALYALHGERLLLHMLVALHALSMVGCLNTRPV